MKKQIIILGLISFLMSCGDIGGSTSNGANSSRAVAEDITGLDLTGTWKEVGIQCWDSTFQNVTAVGSLTASSSMRVSTVQGNKITSLDTGSSVSGSCTVSIERTLVANLRGGDARSGYGTATLGAASATVVPGSTCSVPLEFTMSRGTITPASFTEEYTQGESFPEFQNAFIIEQPFIALLSNFKVVGSPNDFCFMVNQKQP